MGGARVREGGIFAHIRSAVDIAVGHVPVGLARQGERVVQEHLLADPDAALDGERAPDGVHPPLHGREGDGVAAVDHVVSGGVHIHGLGHVPVARGEDHLRGDHGVSRAVGRNGDVQGELAGVRPLHRQVPPVVGGVVVLVGLDLVHEILHRIPGPVPVLDRVGKGRGPVQGDRPDLVLGSHAGEGDLGGLPLRGVQRSFIARDLVSRLRVRSDGCSRDEPGVGLDRQGGADPVHGVVGPDRLEQAFGHGLEGDQVPGESGDGVSHGVGVSSIVQGKRPGLARNRIPGQLDHGPFRGHVHLHGPVLAVVGLVVEREVRVVRSRGLGHHVHDHIGVRRLGQDDLVGVGVRHVARELRLHAVADLVGPALEALREGQSGCGRPGAVEGVLVGLRVVVRDDARLPLAGALGDGDLLSHQGDGVLVLRMTLERDVQPVGITPRDLAQEVVAEVAVAVVIVVAVVVHDHLVGALLVEVHLEERVEAGRAALVHNGGVDASFRSHVQGGHRDVGSALVHPEHLQGRGLKVVVVLRPVLRFRSGKGPHLVGDHHLGAAPGVGGVIDVEDTGDHSGPALHARRKGLVPVQGAGRTVVGIIGEILNPQGGGVGRVFDRELDIVPDRRSQLLGDPLQAPDVPGPGRIGLGNHNAVGGAVDGDGPSLPRDRVAREREVHLAVVGPLVVRQVELGGRVVP